jgi:hypothetical protein
MPSVKLNIRFFLENELIIRLKYGKIILILHLYGTSTDMILIYFPNSIIYHPTPTILKKNTNYGMLFHSFPSHTTILSGHCEVQINLHHTRSYVLVTFLMVKC